MAKVVITKNRDIVGQPTLFLTASGEWKSVSNKQEFKEIASEVKMEHNLSDIDALLGKANVYEEDNENVRVNPEFTPDEWIKFVGI